MESQHSLKVFLTSPYNVKVKDSLPRFREEMGNVDDLAISIATKGQLQPIVVNQDMELIAGGRRLAACIKAQIDVLCIFKDCVDDLTMRELELEENIQRKQFTPAEECKAIADLHALKQARFGESISGKKGGHTLEDTAKLIGKSKAKVIEAISVADAVNKFPELGKCKTTSEIKKAAKAIEQVATRATKAEAYKSEIAKEESLPFTIKHCEASTLYTSLTDNAIDILITDPPYFIDIDKTATAIGGITGGNNASGFSFDDSINGLGCIRELATESYRFCKPTSHAFVFCAPEFFEFTKQQFEIAGWLCYPKPIIWIKREVGQCNAPHAWPSSCYEMLLYCRRVDSYIIKQGQPDWIECPPVPAGAKVHPTEKPLALVRNLIQRVAMPGMLIVDPFMGSGVTIEASCVEQCYAIGCDKLKEAYDVSLERMVTWKRNQAILDSCV